MQICVLLFTFLGANQLLIIFNHTTLPHCFCHTESWVVFHRVQFRALKGEGPCIIHPTLTHVLFYSKFSKISERSMEERRNLTKARTGTGGLYTVKMEKTRAIWTRWSCQEGPKGRMKPAGACHVCIWPHNLWQTPDPSGHKWSRGRHEDHLLASHTRSKAKHSSRHYSLCLPELWNREWRLFVSYRLLPMNFLLGHLRKAEKANGFSKQKNKP